MRRITVFLAAMLLLGTASISSAGEKETRTVPATHAALDSLMQQFEKALGGTALEKDARRVLFALALQSRDAAKHTKEAAHYPSDGRFGGMRWSKKTDEKTLNYHAAFHGMTQVEAAINYGHWNIAYPGEQRVRLGTKVIEAQAHEADKSGDRIFSLRTERRDGTAIKLKIWKRPDGKLLVRKKTVEPFKGLKDLLTADSTHVHEGRRLSTRTRYYEVSGKKMIRRPRTRVPRGYR